MERARSSGVTVGRARGVYPLLKQMLYGPHEGLNWDASSMDSENGVPLLCSMCKSISRVVCRQAVRTSKEVGRGRGLLAWMVGPPGSSRLCLSRS